MRQRSLRLRLLIIFGLGAMILSGVFAALTYEGVHHELVNDLQHTDLHESYENAELVRYTLYTAPPNLDNILNSIEKATCSSRPLANGSRAAKELQRKTCRRQWPPEWPKEKPPPKF